MKKVWLLLGLVGLVLGLAAGRETAAVTETVAAPVLKWQNGGCYNSWCETGWYSSPAVADLDGDGAGEIIVPSDVHYINAYEANAAQIPANPIYGSKGWGKVGIWESLDTEIRGWGRCNGDRAESYRTNFADGPAVIADVNGDGVVEVVVTGNTIDCDTGYPPSKYTGVFIFNADRSRFKSGNYNWETLPVDTGAPLSESYNVIESAMPNPVTADLDGDGEMEILFAAYDGRLHAYWLDKTEHGNWPYNVNATGPGIRFASEPVVADLDNDGRAEVIFTSWPQKGSNYVGKLHILDYLGNALHEISLPAPFGSPDWNGAMAAPTIANIDADADMELVINTAHSGIVAYDLPGTASARILWGTGRGNYQRSGSFLDLEAMMSGQPVTPGAGDTVRFTIRLHTSGPALNGVALTNPLPGNVTWVGNLTASTGVANFSGGVVTWSGTVPGGTAVTISYDVTINNGIAIPTVITNQATVDDGQGNMVSLTAVVIVNGRSAFLPIVSRQ
ncbi:MAG: hypothetical protein HF973_16085 [Chloroflexi bacterium]|nr:hypothetical protein [Chloroflexota bacterium]